MIIESRMILEILGRPAEHVASTLKLLAAQLNKEPGVKIKEETHHPPILVKDSKDMYTSFVELLIEFDNANKFFDIMFKYLPSNVEILSPEKLPLAQQEINVIANYIVQRMHQYDAVTKRMINERDFAISKLQEYAPHLFKKPEQQAQPVQKEEKPAKKSKSKKKK